MNVHKTLGLLCLLSFIYRYCYVFPTTGRLGINHDIYGYATLLLHICLSCSSLLFHVLEYRHNRNPLIIYEEYRIHAILFTLKTIGAGVVGMNLYRFDPKYHQALMVLESYSLNLLVDLTTKYKGTPGFTAVRAVRKYTSKGLLFYITKFFSYY